MKRRSICSEAYFYGEYLVIKQATSPLWEAFTRKGDGPMVSSSLDTEEIDATLRSLTPDPYVQ